MTGWLSPAGVLKPCGLQHCESKALELTPYDDANQAVRMLRAAGWCWVVNGRASGSAGVALSEDQDRVLRAEAARMSRGRRSRRG